MIILAENVQPAQTLAVWQFIVVVAVAPVATIVAIMWAFSQNNKRAEQVKMELTESMANLHARVTDLRADLDKRIDQNGAGVTELIKRVDANLTGLKADLIWRIDQNVAAVTKVQNDVNGQLTGLGAELKGYTSQLRSEMQANKADAKELAKAQMDAAVSKLELKMTQNQSELVRLIGERLPPAAASAPQR
jgi:hypothetical protein